MADCRSSPSPTSLVVCLSMDYSLLRFDAYIYHSTISVLYYLSLKRPKISFIVNKLS